jgi:tripartite-type tricarboxylate transporter receptor subunit TctC
MMTPSRRSLVTLAAAAMAAGLAGPALSQGFPSANVTIVVPYPAGGSVDAVARILADGMAQDLGKGVIVENKGGASGSIGTAAVAKAPADGHMLVLGTNQTHATNPTLLAKLPYDPVKDFVPVIGLTVVPHVLVTRKDLGAADVKSLVAMARAKADGLNYGSTGAGSASHLASELFKKQAGIGTMVHVPFRGGAPLLQELMGGRIDLSIATVPTVIAQIQSGDLKPLAVASPNRSAALKDVPTLAEAGVAGVEADAWFILFAPAGTPKDVVARLSASVSKVMSQPAVQEKIGKLGMAVDLKSGEAIAKDLPLEIAKWAEVARLAGVTAN